MTRIHADRTGMRSVRDQTSMDYEQMYRSRHQYTRNTERMNDEHRSKPTEDQFSGGRTNE